MAYNIYRESMKAAPKLIAWLKKELLESNVGAAGLHYIVDDAAHDEDPLIDQYHPRSDHGGDPKVGTIVQRFCGNYSGGNTPAKAFQVLGGFDKNATAVRNKVLAEVRAFGGMIAKWIAEYTPVANEGECGNVDYRRETRWVLRIELDETRKTPGEGILKKRKLE